MYIRTYTYVHIHTYKRKFPISVNYKNVKNCFLQFLIPIQT